MIDAEHPGSDDEPIIVDDNDDADDPTDLHVPDIGGSD